MGNLQENHKNDIKIAENSIAAAEVTQEDRRITQMSRKKQKAWENGRNSARESKKTAEETQ